MEQIYIKDEYIRLGQALKLAGLVGSGVDAKFVIKEGLVFLNGEKVYERGKNADKAMLLNMTEQRLW